MVGVRLTGLAEVQRTLKKYGATAEDLKGSMSKIGTKAVEDAVRLTPIRTGALRASIRASAAQKKSVIRAGFKRTNYASFVEWGSVHNTAVGMVQKAVKMNERYAVSTIDKDMQALAKRYGLD